MSSSSLARSLSPLAVSLTATGGRRRRNNDVDGGRGPPSPVGQAGWGEHARSRHRIGLSAPLLPHVHAQPLWTGVRGAVCWAMARHTDGGREETKRERERARWHAYGRGSTLLYIRALAVMHDGPSSGAIRFTRGKLFVRQRPASHDLWCARGMMRCMENFECVRYVCLYRGGALRTSVPLWGISDRVVPCQ